MIVVQIEMHPGGDVTRKRHLGTIRIANERSGDLDTGNYRATLSKWGRPSVLWRSTAVRGFPRRRLGAYDLLYRVLGAAVGNRNPGEPLTEYEEAPYRDLLVRLSEPAEGLERDE